MLLTTMVVFVVGCQSPRPRFPQMPSAATTPVTTSDYRTGFPDIIEVVVTGQPDATGHFLVLPDGTLEVGKFGNIPAEGKTMAEIGKSIAEKLGVPSPSVDCRVSQARSRVIQVFGPTGATPVSIPYAGSERLSDALIRAGITSNSQVTEVVVIRRNTAIGVPEETFRSEYSSILAGDLRTNIVLQPNDEIHVVVPHPPFVARFLNSFFKPVN